MANKYHSIDDPYTVVKAIYGGDSLDNIARLAGNLTIRNGNAYVHDYTVGGDVEVNEGVYLVKDPKGLRVVESRAFKQSFGEPLTALEAARWEKARPVTPVSKPGKVTVRNSRTSYMSVTVHGDSDEEMVADAIRQGHEAFGEDADIVVNLSPSRCESDNPKQPRWFTGASITRLV